MAKIEKPAAAGITKCAFGTMIARSSRKAMARVVQPKSRA